MAMIWVNSEGEVQKSSLRNSFLVVSCDDGEAHAAMKSASSIVDYISMRDCFEHDVYRVFDVSPGDGSLHEVTLHGTWHDPDRPLYIKGTDAEGNILFDGYGTDH